MIAIWMAALVFAGSTPAQTVPKQYEVKHFFVTPRAATGRSLDLNADASDGAHIYVTATP
ncbi:hypothetical protein [Rhodanobacter panaciterrae]|uniref:hypothetical protein n=1 Tax=Rhodanobacter panaciterrae TaxID=490572 RepID=UPI0016725B46|nr:hypothetical protein [Rhodanobacter panaciterrae]